MRHTETHAQTHIHTVDWSIPLSLKVTHTSVWGYFFFFFLICLCVRHTSALRCGNLKMCCSREQKLSERFWQPGMDLLHLWCAVYVQPSVRYNSAIPQGFASVRWCRATYKRQNTHIHRHAHATLLQSVLSLSVLPATWIDLILMLDVLLLNLDSYRKWLTVGEKFGAHGHFETLGRSWELNHQILINARQFWFFMDGSLNGKVNQTTFPFSSLPIAGVESRPPGWKPGILKPYRNDWKGLSPLLQQIYRTSF